MRYLFLLVMFWLLVPVTAQTIDNKGRKQGYWKKRDASNKLLYEGEFRDDTPVGKFRYYHPNDSVRAILDFRQNGKVAYARLFHYNGKRMAEGKYINREVKDSVWLFYDEEGVLISKEVYNQGKKHGTCYVYFPDGKISKEENYRDGLLHGSFVEYFDGVLVRSKGQYKDGKMEGRIAYMYPNGVEVAAGYYRNGARNGPWIYKTESGKIRERELYKNGRLADEKETAAFFANPKNQSQNQPASKTPTVNPKKTPGS